MSKTYHASMIPLFIFAALSRAASVASADIPADLSDAVAEFVPECAARCLASFLSVNYARGDDSDQYLTLDFVCAHRGRSGYTVSEGALQCLTAERSVRYCDEDETGDAATSKANDICSGKTDVAKAKGGVITATLRYGSESGVLTFAPITTSASPPLPIPTPTSTAATSPSSTKTTATTTTPTTLITDTRTISSTTTTTTATTTTASSSQTTTSTLPPTVDAAADGPPPPLSKGQIAGISIGAVCITAGFVLGIFLLTRLLVRRRRRRRNSGSSFGGSSPPGGYGSARRDTWGYGFDKTASNSRCSSRAAGGDSLSRYPAMSGAAGTAAGPAPTSGSDNTSKNKEHRLPYNRESWRPSAIGLAISPSKLLADRARTNTPPTRGGNTPTRGRPLSKLLPAKPDMQPMAAAAASSKMMLTTPPPPAPHSVPMGSSYQESYGSQAPKQYQQQQQKQQELLHPIAAQFMRPAERPLSLRLFIPDAEPPPNITPPPPFVPSQDKELLLQNHHRAGRESTLTEFEEDDLRRSTSTAAGQIWCPPSATAAAVPESGGGVAVAAPYYVADGRGNWVLGGDVRSPLSAGSGGGEVLPRIATARTGIVTTAVQTQIPPPRRSPREPTPGGAAAATEETRNMPVTGSNDRSVQLRPNTPQELAATPLKQPPTTRAQSSEAKPPEEPKTPSRIRSFVAKTVPSPLFSRQPNPRSVSSSGFHPLPAHAAAETINNNGRLLTARPAGQERVMSSDSCTTTFSLSSANSADLYHNNTNNPLTPALPTPGGRSANNLSPVVESPPRGRAAAAAATTTTTAGNSTEQGGASSTAGSSSRDSRVFTDPPATVAASETSSGGVSPVSYPRIPGRGTPAPRSRAMFAGVVPLRAAHIGSQPHTGQPNPTMHHGPARQPPPFHFEGPSDPPRYLRDGGGRRGIARGRGGTPRGRGGTLMMVKTRPPSHDMTGGTAPELPRPPSQTSHAAQQHTGPPTLRIVQPSPEPQPAPPRDDRSLLPSSSAAQQPPPPRRRPPSHLPHPFPMYPVSRPRPSPPQPTLPIVADRDSFNRYPGMPMPRPYKPQDRHEPWRPPRASTSPSYDAAAHDNSSQEALATASQSSPSQSSLLAKRLGPTRAADMALVTPRQDRGSERWKQQQHHQQQQQKQKKQGGNEEAQGKSKIPNCPATPDLPNTPTWLPRLTPTRRGTDLVLNVG